MIKYNNNTIYDWNLDTSNLIKVYRNNAIVFYKVSGESPTPEWKVCFAVVDDISQYIDREFEDVFDNATEKWYKLNNLNQYEEYGVYGEGRNITYYDGKLTIDNGYEYQWNGSEWVNVGKITGTTATLPNVPFTVNYNAKNYDASTQTFAKTEGQLANTDVTITGGTLTAHDSYVTVTSASRGVISSYGTYFNRTNSTPNLTIISKQRTEGINCHMFANRTSNYNWMYRPYYNKLTLHGGSEQGGVAVTTQPVIESVRIDSNRLATYNNYTNSTSSTTSSFNYGSTNGDVALFAGYTDSSGEWFSGDFYWIYMSQNTLTDAQVQQVIDYNEGDGGSSEYPIYYTEKSDPLDNLTFNTMAEAQTYAYNNCVYDGMKATIDGNRYYFDSSDENGWVENESRLPQGYTEVEYVENTSTAYLDTGFKPNQDTRIMLTAQTVISQASGKLIGSGGFNRINTMQFCYEPSSTGSLVVSWGTVAGWTTYSSCIGDYNVHTYDWNKNEFYRDDTIVGSVTYANFQCTDNLGIFRHIQAGDSPSIAAYFKGKIFNLKIFDNGTLARDLVPCTRDSDNMVGMYDLVNDVFYYPPNYQSYQLVAGPIV